VSRAALERRLDVVESQVARLRPPDDGEAELHEQCPWLDHVTCGELRELAEIGEHARADGRRHLTPLEQARANEIIYRVERRRLIGLPPVDELKKTHERQIFRAHYDAPRGMEAEAYVDAQLLLERER
jgi:hypothetical protein